MCHVIMLTLEITPCTVLICGYSPIQSVQLYLVSKDNKILTIVQDIGRSIAKLEGVVICRSSFYWTKKVANVKSILSAPRKTHMHSRYTQKKHVPLQHI